MIHSVNFRCIAHATEDLEKVMRAMEFVTGRNDFEIKREKGYYGNEIIIIELVIKRKKEIENFWRRMKEFGVVEEILPILDEIVDSHGNLYLRFDKQEAYLGRLALATHGDVIALRAKIKSYPMKKKIAMENFKKFIRRI
ncbi:MAG: exosome subunit [Thermoplasmata archaeon]|nr:exosome subunit [Thermoplasmata archaeon]